MMINRRTMKRYISLFVFFIFTFNILSFNVVPIFAESKKENKIVKAIKWIGDIPKRSLRTIKKADDDYTPDEIRQIVKESKVKTFNANPANRMANASILLPMKKAGLKVLDGQIGVARSFVINNGITFTSKLVKGDRQATASLEKAKAVVNSMSPTQAANLNKQLKNMPGSTPLVKSSAASSFLKSESKPILISAIAGLINAGIYDGLDVNHIKDKVVTLNALTGQRNLREAMPATVLAGIFSRQMDKLLNHSFDKIYAHALKNSTFSKLDKASIELGKKMFKADRLGVKAGGGDVVKKLGLVGIGSGSRFSLKTLLGSAFKGVTFGLFLNLAGGAIWDITAGLQDQMVVGGNRDHPISRAEYKSFYFQKSEGKGLRSKFRNWKEERRTALRNRYAGQRKWPLSNLLSATGGYVGGTMGAVLAGALLIGAGPAGVIGGVLISALMAGIGSFMGNWAGSKLDRSQKVLNFRRKLWKNKIKRDLKRIYSNNGRSISDEELEKLATARTKDVSKIESSGQSIVGIKFVDSLDNIQVIEKNGYKYLKVDRKNGDSFYSKATPYNDFIDINGNRGIWDPETGKIVNVGKVSKNNGKNIVFIKSSEIIDKNGVLLNKQKGKGFDYLSENGIIMKKIKNKWKVTGIASSYDVCVSDTGERYSWDYDSSSFKNVKVNKVRSQKRTESAEELYKKLQNLHLTYSFLVKQGSTGGELNKIVNEINNTQEAYNAAMGINSSDYGNGGFDTDTTTGNIRHGMKMAPKLGN